MNIREMLAVWIPFGLVSVLQKWFFFKCYWLAFVRLCSLPTYFLMEIMLRNISKCSCYWTKLNHNTDNLLDQGKILTAHNEW